MMPEMKTTMTKKTKDDNDTASLCNAILNNDLEKVQQLIKEGVDVNSPNDKGLRPLHIALMKNNTRIVKFLLSLKDRKIVEVDMTAWTYAIMLDSKEIAELLGKTLDFSKATNLQGETLLHYCVKHRSFNLLNIVGRSCINQVDVNGYSALHLAVIHNDTEMVKRLLELDADVYAKTADGRSSIHFAVKHRCFETLNNLIESNIAVNDPVTSTGSYPLHIAVENDDVCTVNLLIRAGGNVHCKDNEGKNLLHVAVENEYEDMVNLMLKKKVDVNDRFGENHRSALDLALSKRNPKIVTAILNYDPDLNSKDKNGLSAIFIAIENKCLKSINQIFLLKPDFDIVTKDGSSLLHYALKYNVEDITHYLIENDININVINNQGISPLHCAAQYGNANAVTLLINKKLNVNAKSVMHFTPLHLAVLCATEKNADIVNILLNNEAAVHAEDVNKKTPLFYLNYQTGETLKLLLGKGADVNHLDATGSTMMYDFSDTLSSFIFKEDVFSTLIQYKANFNKINSNDDNIFHAFAERNLFDVDVLERYFSNGVNINGVNKNNQTPLNVCLENEANVELVTYFTSKGAIMNINNKGESSLHLAIKAQQYKTVKFLLDHGAEIKDTTVDGSSLLHYAVQYNKKNQENGEYILKLFLEEYADTLDINAKNVNGETPLHLAASKNSLEMVKTLSKCENIDINIKDAQDNSPLCYAITNKNFPMVKLLLKKGACTSDMYRGMSIYDLAEQSGDKHIYQTVLLY